MRAARALVVGAVLVGTLGCTGFLRGKEGRDAGECSDGADNDADGLFDCDDDGCAGSPDCDGAATASNPGSGTGGTDGAACEVEQTGVGIGDVPPDFVWTDENGADVHLYGFCGDVVWVEFVALWDAASNAMAPGREDEYLGYAGEGVTFVDVVVEDVNADPATAADAAAWREAFDLTFPVVADHDEQSLFALADGADAVGLPYGLVLDRDLSIVAKQNADSGDVDQLLP